MVSAVRPSATCLRVPRWPAATMPRRRAGGRSTEWCMHGGYDAGNDDPIDGPRHRTRPYCQLSWCIVRGPQRAAAQPSRGYLGVLVSALQRSSGRAESCMVAMLAIMVPLMVHGIEPGRIASYPAIMMRSRPSMNGFSGGPRRTAERPSRGYLGALVSALQQSSSRAESCEECDARHQLCRDRQLSGSELYV